MEVEQHTDASFESTQYLNWQNGLEIKNWL